MLTKKCSTCKKELPYSEFYPHKRMKLGLQPSCKTCSRQWHRDIPDYVREKNAEYKRKNPTYHTDWQRKTKYGASKEHVDEIRKTQGNKCAICSVDLNNTKECLDHCHASGTIRGLLCNSCNLAIWYAKDSIDVLEKMIAYLQRNRIEAENY